MDNKQTNQCGYIPIQLYLQKTDGLGPEFANSIGRLEAYFCGGKFSQVLFSYRNIFQVACSQGIIFLIIYGPEVYTLKDTCTIPYCAVLAETEAEGIRLCKTSFALITTLADQHIRSCIPSEPEISVAVLAFNNESNKSVYALYRYYNFKDISHSNDTENGNIH